MAVANENSKLRAPILYHKILRRAPDQEKAQDEDRPAEFHALDFKPTKAGRQNIQDVMERLLQVDREAFPETPIIDPDGIVQIPAKRKFRKIVSWNEILTMAPSYFENLYQAAKTRDSLSKRVHDHFHKILTHLQAGKREETRPDYEILAWGLRNGSSCSRTSRKERQLLSGHSFHFLLGNVRA